MNNKVTLPVWIDKSASNSGTQVSAANLNAMCEGINQNASDISSLSDALVLLDKTKFDKVMLEGNTLKFYAKEIEKFSISLPTGSGGSGVPGQDGREIELRKSSTHIEWRYVGESNWTQLVSLNELKGNDGVTPNITIGNVETLSPGSQATVTRRGTTEAPIFDFGIPQGQPGGGEGGPVDLSAYQTKRDENLTTTEKEIVAAINEVASDTSQNKNEISDLGKLKFDKVTIEGSILKFFANNLEKFSITLPVNSDGSIALNSITPSMTTFLRNSENLFNKDDVGIETGKFINALGNFSNGSGYNISGFIEAKANDVFTHRFNNSLSGKDATFIYYDANKTKLGFASGVLSSDETTCTITMPDNNNIAYFRVTFTDAQKLEFMVVSGEVYPNKYIKYGEVKLVDNVVFNNIQESNIKELSLKAILENPIDASQTNFVLVSKNLFNKNDEDIQIGKFINNSGGISSASGYNISGFIDVVEQESYVYKFNKTQLGTNTTYLYYDEEGSLLGNAKGIISEDELTCSLTAPVGAKKIKISFMETDKNSLMFVRGSSYPSGYEEYGTIKLTESIGLNDKQKEEIRNISPINPLYGKIIAANGDSICYGAGFTGGFVKIIAERNGMTYQNIAVNGATVTAGTVDSNTSENRHWICRTISNMREDADYCLLEGSVNDIGDNVTFGSITDTMTASLDDTTFCGAFESMLKQATLRFKGKKIGFILVHRMFNLDHDYHTKYYPAILKMCEKWGVPLCNLYTTVPSLNLINDLKQLYTKNADGWHPNEEGYRKYYCDKIEQFLISL